MPIVIRERKAKAEPDADWDAPEPNPAPVPPTNGNDLRPEAEPKKPGFFARRKAKRAKKKADKIAAKELKARRKVAGEDWPKWKVHYVHALIQNLDMTYDVISWDNRDPIPTALALEHGKLFDETCIMRLYGWWPLARDWPLAKKMRVAMRAIQGKAIRHGLLIYTESDTDLGGDHDHRYPWTVQDMCLASDCNELSPELLQRYAESNLDNDLLKSMQTDKTVNTRMILIIVLVLVGAVVAARMMGVF